MINPIPQYEYFSGQLVNPVSAFRITSIVVDAKGDSAILYPNKELREKFIVKVDKEFIEDNSIHVGNWYVKYADNTDHTLQDEVFSYRYRPLEVV